MRGLVPQDVDQGVPVAAVALTLLGAVPEAVTNTVGAIADLVRL